MRERPHQQLPLWAHLADAVALALIFLALYVAIAGGFVIRPAGVRIAIRLWSRPMLWAALLMVLRHLLARRPPLHARVATGVMTAARAAGPLRDDLWPTAAGIGEPAEKRGTGAGWRRTALYAIAVIGLYSALTAVMTYPQVRHLSNGVSPDMGDALFSTWRLSWFAHQLPRDPIHLFDANIFYPERATLAYSDAMVVPSLMVAPLLWVGVHQVLAYNLLFLSGFALSGAAMFLLVWSLTRHLGGALLAGFVFAFLPYRFMHYAHLELQMAQWMPLCLWAFHRTVNGGRLRDGVLTGVFLALQTLSSMYYGIFFATFLVPVGIATLIGAGRRQAVRAIRPFAAGAVLAAVIVLPFVLPYFAARRSVGERPVSEIEYYSATGGDYLAAHPRNVVFGPLTAGWGGQERELFQGLAVPLLALVALWPPLSAARIGYAIGLALALELSLGFNGVLYQWMHAYVLPYRGLRVPARMAIIVGLTLAIFVGYAVARICSKGSTFSASAAAFLLLAGLVYGEYRSTVTLGQVWASPPAVYSALDVRKNPVVLELPLIAPDIELEPIYMYFSTFGWHRLVNGYSGFSPFSYYKLVERMAKFPDEVTFAELRRRDVDYVIVHGAFYDPDAYRRLVSRLDRRAELTPAGRFEWQGRETRLYRMIASPPPGAAGGGAHDP